MAILCERIAKEQNLAKFKQFVRELNELLGRKEQRLKTDAKPRPPNAPQRDRISARSKRPGSRTS
jgi:hypothetical protein